MGKWGLEKVDNFYGLVDNDTIKPIANQAQLPSKCTSLTTALDCFDLKDRLLCLLCSAGKVFQRVNISEDKVFYLTASSPALAFWNYNTLEM